MVVLGKAYNPKPPVNGQAATLRCNYTSYQLVRKLLANGPQPVSVLQQALVAQRNHPCFVHWLIKTGKLTAAKAGATAGPAPKPAAQVVKVAKLA